MGGPGLAIVAMPMSAFTGKKYRVPGSVVDYCAACKAPVSLAPSSQKILETPKSRVLCVDCAMSSVRAEADAGGEVDVVRATPEQAGEIDAWLRSRGEGAR